MNQQGKKQLLPKYVKNGYVQNRWMDIYEKIDVMKQWQFLNGGLKKYGPVKRKWWLENFTQP